MKLIITKEYELNYEDGEFIAKQLKERKISQKDIAKALGLSASYVSLALYGRKKAPIRLINYLVDTLGISLKFEGLIVL